MGRPCFHSEVECRERCRCYPEAASPARDPQSDDTPSSSNSSEIPKGSPETDIEKLLARAEEAAAYLERNDESTEAELVRALAASLRSANEQIVALEKEQVLHVELIHQQADRAIEKAEAERDHLLSASAAVLEEIEKLPAFVPDVEGDMMDAGPDHSSKLPSYLERSAVQRAVTKALAALHSFRSSTNG